MEVGLLAFYGGLLLITPAFSGLVRGRLPIEISARGAKFVDEVGHSAELNEAAIRRLEQRVNFLTEDLTEATVELGRLKGEVTVRDGR